MKTSTTHETLYGRLRRLLNENVGLHARIARESGVSQATVSRIHLGKAVPTLNLAQNLFDWFDRQADAKSCRRRGVARKTTGA